MGPKNWGSKQLWVQKSLYHKDFGSKNFRSKISWVKKKVTFKIFDPKQMWLKKNVAQKVKNSNIKIFRVQQILLGKKNLVLNYSGKKNGPKIFGSEEIWLKKMSSKNRAPIALKDLVH